MPFALSHVFVSGSENVHYLLPPIFLVPLLVSLHEPIQLPHAELLYRPLADEHADQVAAEEVEKPVVPPALLKVRQPDLHSPLHYFECDAHYPSHR